MDENDEFVLKLISQDGKKPPLWQTYVCISLSAINGEFYTYPFDVTKTRLHLQGEAASKGEQPAVKHGMIRTAYGIFKNEGFTNLYGGLSAMVLRCCSFNAIRVVVYDAVRQKLVFTNDNGKEVLTMPRALAGGAIAGGISQLVCNPLDILKIRMQMEGRRKMEGLSPRVTGIPSGFAEMYKVGGIIGMWRGVIPCTLRAILMTVGDTAMYDVSKRNIMRVTNMSDGTKIQFLSSVSAGFFASFLSTPMDVIKSRIMNQPVDDKGVGLHYKGTMDCLYKLVTQEGVFAMYKGFTPCWMRIGPWSVVFWVTFEQMRSLLGMSGF